MSDSEPPPPAAEEATSNRRRGNSNNADDSAGGGAVGAGGTNGALGAETNEEEDRLIEEELGGRENVEAVARLFRDVAADPSILQRPEYAAEREAIGRLLDVIRRNPHLYPLNDGGGGGGGGGNNGTSREDTRILECFCPQNNDGISNGSGQGQNAQEHTDLCKFLQPRRREIGENPEEAASGELYNLAHELHSMSSEGTYHRADDDDGPAMDVAISDSEVKVLEQKSLKYYCTCVGRSQNLVSLVAMEEFPFLLVSMGKYDELCALLVNSTRDSWRGAVPLDWRRSAIRGEFPFAIEEGSSLRDLIDVVNGVEIWNRRSSETVPFLVSFLFMKVRLLCQRREEREEWIESIRIMLDSTSSGRTLGPVQSTILEMASGTAEYRDPIEGQIPRIMDIIDGRNPTILPALVHPAPLIEATPQPLAPILLPRTPAEAFTTLQTAGPLFRRIPHARTILVERFGETPRYHHDPFDYTAEQANFIP